jgi:16S rRNA (uracil1498-N3)-methyltransferase
VNQFLISSSDVVGTLLTLTGSEARHAIQVLRLRKGEHFLATDGKGLKVKAQVTDLQKDYLLAEIVEQVQDSEPSSRITVALGLIKKRDRLEFALEKLTELGVHRIVLFEGDHSERSKARPDRLELIVQSAVKQSLGSWLPEVHMVESMEGIFTISVEEAKLGMRSEAQTGSVSGYLHWDELFLADETLDAKTEHTDRERDQKPDQTAEKLTDNISILNWAQQHERLLIVGPEGGFSKRERDWIVENHPECQSISLGSRRLRAETAAIAGLLSLSSLV